MMTRILKLASGDYATRSDSFNPKAQIPPSGNESLLNEIGGDRFVLRKCPAIGKQTPMVFARQHGKSLPLFGGTRSWIRVGG